jgi:hypothetical protein
LVCSPKVWLFKITAFSLLDRWTEFRPYLHIYAHSNELEETGIVSLAGINVESDPHKESLLGVRFLSCSWFTQLKKNTCSETVLVHSFHRLQFSCVGSPKCKGTTILDIEIGSHSFTLLIPCDSNVDLFIIVIYYTYCYTSHTHSLLVTLLSRYLHVIHSCMFLLHLSSTFVDIYFLQIIASYYVP